jgi:hypothetical protein
MGQAWRIEAQRLPQYDLTGHRGSGWLRLAACARCGPLCLFAPARQPQAFTINPRLYLYVTRLA